MRIHAKMVLPPMLSYEQMCKDIPSTVFLFPDKQSYNMKFEEHIDVHIVDIKPLDLLGEEGVVWQEYILNGIVREEDVVAMGKCDGYIVEFSDEDIEADEHLRDLQHTWFSKQGIHIVC